MNRKSVFKRKGGGYAVRYHVPAELRKTLGKREIVRGLNTADRHEAMILKTGKLLEIQAEVFKLISGGSPKSSIVLPVDSRQPELHHLKRKEPTLPTRRKSPRLSRAAREWFKMMNGVTPHTKNRYRRSLTVFTEYFCDCRVDEIERRDAIAYVNHLKATPSTRTGRPLSPKSIKTEITTLSSFYKVATHLGFYPEQFGNPFHGAAAVIPGVKREKTKIKTLRPVTRDEAIQYLEACAGTTASTHKPFKYAFEMKAIIQLLWATGARANEIASLERDQISDDGDVIWLQLRNSKTEAGNRSLCLVGESECCLIREALAKADAALLTSKVPNENRNLLFPKLLRGGFDRKPYWYVGKALEKVRKDTFGKDVQWDMHSFRRNAVAALVNAGVSTSERNLVIGHSNKGDIGISVYSKEADLRKVVKRTFYTLYEELSGGVIEV